MYDLVLLLVPRIEYVPILVVNVNTARQFKTLENTQLSMEKENTNDQ